MSASLLIAPTRGPHAAAPRSAATAAAASPGRPLPALRRAGPAPRLPTRSVSAASAPTETADRRPGEKKGEWEGRESGRVRLFSIFAGPIL